MKYSNLYLEELNVCVCVCLSSSVVCVCVPSSVFLHVPECVSALSDLSLSTDKYSKTRDRQTQEYIYMHLQTDMT